MFMRSFIQANGVDLDAFNDLPPRSAVLDICPSAHDRSVVLFLGRIDPKKGVDQLILGFDKARQELPELFLVIAGPGSGAYVQKLRDLASSTSSADSIQFVGPVYGESKMRVLGGADVFALTSHEEGDSVAVKEALAAGLPVLVTPGCKIDYIHDPTVGVTVEATPSEIAGGILRLAETSIGRPEPRARAKALARGFDSRVVAERMILEYQRMVDSEQ
ncbi:MAG: glycosyltransferase, partial [Gemmatimonadota bacterium]